MNSIWKFPLNKIGGTRIEVPSGAEIITVQYQNDIPTVWAIVDPDKEKVEKAIYQIGTGFIIKEELLEKLYYIGTLQDQDKLVWHYFAEV